MGGCASTPKGIDLTKEALSVDNHPSKPAQPPQTVVVAETGNGGDVEKKEAETGVDKAVEAKPEAAAAVEDNKPAAEVKPESSPVEAVAEKEVAVATTTEEKKAEAVVAPKAEIAEKAAEPSKVEEKTDVSPVTTA